MPIFVTEQNPKALGVTGTFIMLFIKFLSFLVPEIDISKAKKYEKMKFSMVNDDMLSLLSTSKIQSVLLVGIEAHVCVLQTALDLIEKGFEVHVLGKFDFLFKLNI